MAELRITITTLPDAGRNNNTPVSFIFNPGFGNFTIQLAPTLNANPSGSQFYVPPFDGASIVDDSICAQSMAAAVVRAYNSLGLTAEADGETCIIRGTGTFSGYANTGNYIVTTQSIIADGVDPFLRIAKTFVSDCDANTLRYTAVEAVGGTSPYQLIELTSGASLIGSWSGAAGAPQDFDLPRGTVRVVRLVDSLGDTFSGSWLRTIVTPRKYQSSDFEIVFSVFQLAADMRINQVNEQFGRIIEEGDTFSAGFLDSTRPVQEQLQVRIVSPGAPTPYQNTNVFNNLVPNTVYTIEVLDVFGCTSQFQVSVPEFTGTDPNGNLVDEPYFSITEYNSLSFKRCVEFGKEFRKNYNTVVSYEDAVRLPSQDFMYFCEGDKVQTQFKSSYPFHKITIYRCDGTTFEPALLRIQQNIAIRERVDARVFDVSDPAGIGIYFSGGDRYDPVTGNIIGTSPYFLVLPEWAQVGNTVDIVGLGNRTIIQTNLYDPVRNTLYFVVEGQSGLVDDSDVITDARFNRHPYDVYRFDFDMWDGTGVVVVEGRPTEDTVAEEWVSETFKVLKDPEHWLQWRWYLDYNMGEAVAYDDFEGLLWVEGRARPFSISSAEVIDADDRTRSVDQDSRLGVRVKVHLKAPRLWHKMDLVAAIGDNVGTLIIEDQELVRRAPTQQEEKGLTNLSDIEIEFSCASETPRRSPAEAVFQPGEGDPTDVLEPIDVSGVDVLRDTYNDGVLLLDLEGNPILQRVQTQAEYDAQS